MITSPTVIIRKIFIRYHFVLSLILVIFMSNIISFDKYNFAFEYSDLRYIEQAEEYKAGLFFRPITNAINPPGYPLFLYLISFFSSLNPLIIRISQGPLMSIGFSLVFRYLYVNKMISEKKFFLAFIFFFMNPIFYYFNDGGVFPEYFTATILMLTFGVYLRTKRYKTNFHFLLLSFFVGYLSITRYEFIILALFLIINSTTKLRERGVILLFPILFLSINTLKNYMIFDEFKITNYSSYETIWGGVSKDCNWHKLDLKNYKVLTQEKYHTSINKALVMEYGKERIIHFNGIYKEIVLDRYQNNTLDIIKKLPVKLCKIWIVNPVIDDTNIIKEHCRCSFYDSLKLSSISHHFFHYSLLVMLLFSALVNRKSKFFITMFSMIFMYSFLYSVVFYPNPRFIFNLYPIIIVLATTYFHLRIKYK